MSSFDEDSVSATIIGSDGNGFIEEAVEMFHANSFVVAAISDMEVDIQSRTDLLEQALESAAIINSDQTAETDFQKNILDKKAGKIVR